MMDANAPDLPPWRLELYITQDSIQCRRAMRLLTELVHERLRDRCTLEIIDLKKRPELAREKNILVLPTLIRLSPEPVRMLFGALGSKEALAEALEMLDD